MWKIKTTHGKIWNFLLTYLSTPTLLLSSIITVYTTFWEVVLVMKGNTRGFQVIIMFWFLIWVLDYPDVLILGKYIRLSIYDFYTFLCCHNILVKILSRKWHDAQTYCIIHCLRASLLENYGANLVKIELQKQISFFIPGGLMVCIIISGIRVGYTICWEPPTHLAWSL